MLALWGLFYSSLTSPHGGSGHHPAAGRTAPAGTHPGKAPDKHGNPGSAGTVLTVREVARRVNPALVDVVSTLGYQQAAAAGTGLVLTPSGEILTNNHVIEGATAVRVIDVGNGRSYRARVVGYDRSRDIAVLQLRGASGLATVTLGDSSTARIGQRVVAIGNAGGKGGTPSVVTGRITGLNASVIASDRMANAKERLTGLIAHNAPIRPGDSGGPLLNRAAQAIGINTAASNGRFQLSTHTRAYAIPMNRAAAIARAIEAGAGSATVHIGATGFIGVQVESVSRAAANGVSPGSGALVAGVLPGTPAARAGLTAGDVITSVGGQRVGSPLGLQAVLELHHPGDTVTISWRDRAGRTRSASLVLAKGPAG